MIKHSTIPVSKGIFHVAESGVTGRSPILFLHGWPENWKAFESLLKIASETHHAIAIDLPGIGDSIMENAPYYKHEIAECIHELVDKLKLENLTIVGHDTGGQVVFSYLQLYSKEIHRAVIMDVVIPGLTPWEDVLRNPYIWHFAFHSIPKLPEILVAGKEKEYFDFFYEAITAHPEKITQESRENYIRAYSRPESLSTGFNWYRAFSEDSKHNKENIGKQIIGTPLLYLRGERSGGKMEQYISGFNDAGITNIKSKFIPGSGHFVAEEQPKQVWQEIIEFLKASAGTKVGNQFMVNK